MPKPVDSLKEAQVTLYAAQRIYTEMDDCAHQLLDVLKSCDLEIKRLRAVITDFNVDEKNAEIARLQKLVRELKALLDKN